MLKPLQQAYPYSMKMYDHSRTGVRDYSNWGALSFRLLLTRSSHILAIMHLGPSSTLSDGTSQLTSVSQARLPQYLR